MKRIVIVGGGIGGIFTANKLVTKLGDAVKKGEVEITVFEPSRTVVYQPGFLYIPFMELPRYMMFKETRRLLNPLVKLIPESVEIISIKDGKVKTASGKEYSYDYLVISTGSEARTDAFPGLGSRWHTLWTYEGAKQLRRALSEFRGGTLVLSVTSIPYKCPVAPYEFLFMLDDYLMRRGIKRNAKVIFTTVAPHIHAQPNVNRFLESEMSRRGIEYRTKFEVGEIGEGYVDGTERIKADLIVAVPPHSGAEPVKKSGIGDGAGWVPVDRFTLRVVGGSGAEYALGDATSLPVPKAGSVAHFQSEVVASRIAEELDLGYSDTVYTGRVMCFILTGLEEATQVSWNYEAPALYPPPPSKVFFRLKDLTNCGIWGVARAGL